MKKTLIIAFMAFLMVGCSSKAKHSHNNTDTLSDDTTTIAQDSLSIASPAEAEIAADTTAELNSYCELFLKYDSIAKAAFRERREQGFDKFYDDLGFYKMVDPSGKYKSVAEAEKECSLLWDSLMTLSKQELDKEAVELYTANKGKCYLHLKYTWISINFHYDFMENLIFNIYPLEEAYTIYIDGLEFINKTTHKAIKKYPSYDTKFYDFLLLKLCRAYNGLEQYDKALGAARAMRKLCEIENDFGLGLAEASMEEAAFLEICNRLDEAIIALDRAERGYKKYIEEEGLDEYVQGRLDFITTYREDIRQQIKANQTK